MYMTKDQHHQPLFRKPSDAFAASVDSARAQEGRRKASVLWPCSVGEPSYDGPKKSIPTSRLIPSFDIRDYLKKTATEKKGQF